MGLDKSCDSMLFFDYMDQNLFFIYDVKWRIHMGVSKNHATQSIVESEFPQTKRENDD